MFKQITPFTLVPESIPPSAAEIEELAQQAAFVPCGASQDRAVGFVPPRAEHGALVEQIGAHYILQVAIESKSVPPRVVSEKLAEQVAEIEASTGRKPGKKERRALQDEILLSLLPQAFPTRSHVPVWICLEARTLVVGSASVAKTDAVVGLLVSALRIGLRVLQTMQSPQRIMTEMLLAESPEDWPGDFAVERECLLKAADESGAAVRYSCTNLQQPEIREHVTEGMLPSQLALSFDGRVSFVLTDQFKLTKIKFLGGVLDGDGEGNEERFDADVALATGTLEPLLNALVDAMGGEAQAELFAQEPAHEGEADPLYDTAVALVIQHRKPSISLVQRHLQIGYNRAARLLEEMEVRGVVSCMGSNGQRQLLTAKEAA